MTVQDFVDHIGTSTKINFFDARTKQYVCTLPSDSPLISVFSEKMIDTFDMVVIAPIDDEPYRASYSLYINN